MRLHFEQFLVMRSAALQKEVHLDSRLLARPDWCFLANKRPDLAKIFQGGKLLHDGVFIIIFGP